MSKYIDFHCHSLYSDGNYSVNELIKKAKGENVGFLSITDHDNIRSINDIKKYSLDTNITLINGIELSTVILLDNKELYLHLLGYDFDSNNIKLLSELKRMREVLYRDNSIFLNSILNNVKNVPNCIVDELDLYSYRLLEKQIRIILRKNNYDVNYIDNFILLISKYFPTYEDYEIDFGSAIDIMRTSGGISVLAHPNKIRANDVDNIIKLLVNNGLNGIETAHSSFLPSDFIKYSEIAKKYGLLESVGSDFHFPTPKKNVIIGHGIDGNLCKDDCSLKRYVLERKKKNG